MRLFLMIAIAAMTTFCSTAADLAGKWKGTMSTRAGDAEVVITIKPGASLAGEVQAGDYEGAMQNAKSAGDKLSFEVSIGPGMLSFEGTVAGDQMTFDVVGTQGDKYTLTCKRE